MLVLVVPVNSKGRGHQPLTMRASLREKHDGWLSPADTQIVNRQHS